MTKLKPLKWRSNEDLEYSTKQLRKKHKQARTARKNRHNVVSEAV